MLIELYDSFRKEAAMAAAAGPARPGPASQSQPEHMVPSPAASR